MKYLILLLALLSCTTGPVKPERTMANCKLIKDNYYICQEIPAHATKDVPPERTIPHSNSYRY